MIDKEMVNGGLNFCVGIFLCWMLCLLRRRSSLRNNQYWNAHIDAGYLLAVRTIGWIFAGSFTVFLVELLIYKVTK